MDFYEQISKYYDYIFPVGQAQLDFIRKSAGVPPKKVLDVACGSGGYTAELLKSRYVLTAVDLDVEMVEKTKERVLGEGFAANVLRCDMKELDEKLNPGFDCIFCIGNSVVHLGSYDEVFYVLKQMYSLLGKEGILILQIINYDRIIKYSINELPTIRNEEIGLEFVRKYDYAADKGLINFNTTLTVNGKGAPEVFENSIELLPLKSGTMHELLEQAGFKNIEFFGGFNASPYDEESYMLVVRAGR